MLSILSVGAGGFIGAVLRYLIGLIPVNEVTVFPIKTFFINVIGCVLIGLIVVSVQKNFYLSPQMALFLKVGICGGFTTFSTFALETNELMEAGHIWMALLYVVLSVLVGVGVIFLIKGSM